MDRRRIEIHMTPDEARAGRTMNTIRFVLAISVLLAICALALVWAATRATARAIDAVPPAPAFDPIATT